MFSSASVPNLNVNFSNVKVKVQGQHHSTETPPLALARLWLEISSSNVTEVFLARNNYDLTKFKMAEWRRFALLVLSILGFHSC